MKKNRQTILYSYFNLANFITVCEMYLNKISLPLDIKYNDLKERPVGHWGTSPAINAIFSALYLVSCETNLKYNTFIGTGHSGAAYLANLFIQNKLTNYPCNLDGLNKLIKDYGTKLRTEINSSYPYSIYFGGELGYSLAESYGYALDNADGLIVTIIGDGEMETGTLSSSWIVNNIRKKSDGNILPIINMNNFKMTSRSLYSYLSDKQLSMHFESLGFKVYLVNENLLELYNTIKSSVADLKNGVSPIVIFKNRKGFTGISDTVNTRFSHKNPLSIFNSNEKLIVIKKWLNSYGVNSLEIFEKSNLFDRRKYNQRKYNIDKYFTEKQVFSNIKIVENFIRDNRIYLFSPDEIASNKLDGLISYERLYEVLNEQLLNCMMVGNVLADKPSIFIGYEAFMNIAESITVQHLKYIKEGNVKCQPLTYILTSVCYENNYSHQNPGFVSTLLATSNKNVNYYYPKDANNLLMCLKKSLEQNSYVNTITTSKTLLPQYNSINTSIEFIKKYNSKTVIIVTGDIMLDYALKLIGDKKISVVYVTNLAVLRDNNEEYLRKYFPRNKNLLYFYHGNKSDIAGLLHGKISNIKIFGYKNESHSTGSIFEKIEDNFLINEGDIYE